MRSEAWPRIRFGGISCPENKENISFSVLAPIIDGRLLSVKPGLKISSEPSTNVVPLSFVNAHVGPAAHLVRDCALIERRF
jgi:hypothetical protein